MGKTITCTFAVHVPYENGDKEIMMGANSLIDAYNRFLAVKSFKDITGKYYVWPQTALGRSYMKNNADYIEINGFTHDRKYMSVLGEVKA